MPNLAVVRENIYAIGWGKQGGWDTPVAATDWWRWLDGTEANPETGFNQEREGDTSPHLTLVYKTHEYGKLTIVEYVRPRTIGCALQSVLGTGSDTYTPPTVATTVGAGGATAGGTTISSVADLGNTSTVVVAVNSSGSTYEIVTLDKTTRSGIGPYTYTLAGGATFLYNHSAAETIVSQCVHTFKRALTTYDPYTIEVQYGVSGTAPYDVEQYVNCVCTELRFSVAAGQIVRAQHTWYSTSFRRKASFTSPVSYEGTNIIGSPGSPFVWWQGQNAWQVDGSNVNGRVRQGQFVMRNSTQPDDLQTDGINPAYFELANMDVQGQGEIVWTSYDQYYKAYYGNTTSPTSTASDSPLTGTGSFQATLTEDSINALILNLPAVAYTAAKKPSPKLAGQSMKQQLMMTGQKTPAQPDPIIITLKNARNSVY